MESKALTPRDLFDGKVNYEIPPFQRPYVWTEEDQWQPLWNDVVYVTEQVIDADGRTKELHSIAGHFLGAVVLKQLDSAAGDPIRWSVIDGQQRLTTLQLLLDAAQVIVERHGEEDDSETIFELVVNSAKRFAKTEKRFKLWPSRVDRQAFEIVMDNEIEATNEVNDSRIAQAHIFFQQSIEEWLKPSAVNTTENLAKLAALTQVLENYLSIVAITLESRDDDQLIFETLNDRGTPLLAADLIKNFVFIKCEQIGADVDKWADRYWLDFDGDWWREQISQGRMFRSRIDLFLQYWLTMRTLTEVQTDSVFKSFQSYAADQLATQPDAETFLENLRRDADTFRDLAQLDPSSAKGSFYSKIVESLEQGAFIPLLLWMISDNHNLPTDEVDKGLAAVESWVVRRMLLRRTMKDVNKMVVALLQHINDQPLKQVGNATVDFLKNQTADAREWPTDEQVIDELPAVKLYGNIKQQRLRVILSAIELILRTERSEDVSLPSRLEIEHIMPRGWREYWGEGIGDNPELASKRDMIINTVGNLTLVTQKLNSTLSNRPWRDEEAAIIAPSGKHAGLGKRSLLNQFSILAINKEIIDGHSQEWTDQDIADRSKKLAVTLTEIWPR